MHLVNVDPVRLKALQGILNLPFYARSSCIPPDFVLIIVPVQSHLRGQCNLVPTAVSEGLAHNLFGTTEAVYRGRIDQANPLVDGPMNRIDGLGFIRSAPHPATNGPGA